MSLSLIAWNPRIDDPSNPIPSLNSSSVSSLRGMEKCCQVPGRSVNLKSTTCTPASLALRITSAGEAPAPGFAAGLEAVGSNVAVMVALLRRSGESGLSARPMPGTTRARPRAPSGRSEEHTSELQSHSDLVCRLLLEKKKKKKQS